MGCESSSAVNSVQNEYQVTSKGLPVVSQIISRGTDGIIQAFQKAYYNCREMEIVKQEIFQRNSQIYADLEFKLDNSLVRISKQINRDEFYIDKKKYEGRLFFSFISRLTVAKHIPHLPGIQTMYRGNGGETYIETMEIDVPQFLEIHHNRDIITMCN